MTTAGARGMTALTVGPRAAVLVGRGMAAASALMVAYALVVLLAMGRLGYIVDDYVPHLALVALAFAGLTWRAVARRPGNGAVWAAAWTAMLPAIGVAASATCIALGELAGLDMSRAAFYALAPADVPPVMALSAMLSDVGWVGLFIPATLGLLLFPDGSLPSHRWRWVGWGSVVTMVILTVLLMVPELPDSTVRFGADAMELTGPGRLVEPLMLALTAFSCCCVASVIVGYRRSEGVLRQQYRWLGLAAAVLLGTIGLVEIAGFVWDIDPFGWGRIVMLLGIAAAVACYGIGVTRYRLYDIDVIVSRAATYGVLAMCIATVYVVLVVVAGGILDLGAQDPVLAIGAMTMAAIAFDPLRSSVQRWAGHLVYGRRADPYEVLSDLVPRLATGTSRLAEVDPRPVDRLLARMAELAAGTTGAAAASVWAADDGALVALAGWPRLPTPTVTTSIEELSGTSVALRHGRELLGALQVVESPREPLTATGRRTLADLAGLAGLVLDNRRLDEALVERLRQLRASRRRLVDAQDLERRRLEEELRAAVDASLLAFRRRVGRVERAARAAGAVSVADLLSSAASAVRDAAGEIDALARGLRPPALATGGLSAALWARAAELPLPVTIEVDGIDGLPEPVTSAFYFVAMEAIANALKHARASRLRVTICVSGRDAILEVGDDGVGLPEPGDPQDGLGAHDRLGVRTLPPTGSRGGSVNMRDRVEALGGSVSIHSSPGRGTTVRARIPVG